MLLKENEYSKTKYNASKLITYWTNFINMYGLCYSYVKFVKLPKQATVSYTSLTMYT